MEWGSGVNIEDIQTFLAIVETKNFSRAGSLLFISQSTVTARIKSLEKELHRQLFIRSNSSVELTVYGQTFLRYARRACDLLTEGKRVLNLSEEYTSSLCVGAPDSIWHYTLFPFVERLKQSEPGVALHLLCEHSTTLVEGILDASVDLAVVLANPNQRQIQSELLWISDFILVKRPGLELPDTVFSPETIHRFPFIQMFWGHPFLSWFDSVYQPNISPYEVDRVFLYTDLLLHGLGIGFLPRRIAAEHLQNRGLEEIPYELAETAPKEHGYLICSKHRSEELETHIQMIKGLLHQWETV